MKKTILLLLLIPFGNLFASNVQILFLKGKSEFVRKQKTSSLTKNIKLVENDLIQTSKNSFVKIKVFDTELTIGPNSIMKISNKTREGTQPVGQLLYGHLYTKFLKSVKNTSRLLSSPSASMGVRGTTILLHVTRDQSEYYERVNGKVHKRPSMNEMKERFQGDKFFSQICCIEGKVEVNTKAGKRLQILEGDVLNYTGIGQAIEKNTYSSSSILNTAKQLGFN